MATTDVGVVRQQKPTFNLGIGRPPLTAAIAGGMLLLGLAGLSLILGLATWLAPLLAVAATIMLARDSRLGWLPAGLIALIALPYGRAADSTFADIAGFPLRTPDLIIGVAVAGALTRLPGAWRIGIDRDRWLLAALLVFLAVGAIALVIGLLEGSALRDIGRDLRFWMLYAAGGLALVLGVRRAPLVRALLIGGALYGLVLIAAVMLPIFEGGLKADVLAYDRGTLRMQFSNNVFLLPGIAFCGYALIRRLSVGVALTLVLLVATLVLSLTRMSMLAGGLAVMLVVLLALWGSRNSLRNLAVLRGISWVALICAVGGTAAILLSSAQATNEHQPGLFGEDPMERILGRADESSLDSIVSSDSGRLATYREALDIIYAAPVLGSGLGQLVPVEFAYSPRRAHIIGMQPGVDNAYLTFGMKAGLLGMAAIAVLLLWPLLAAVRGASSRFAPWFLAAWLAILPITMTQSFASSGYGPFGISLLIAFLSLRRLPHQTLLRSRSQANLR